MVISLFTATTNDFKDAEFSVGIKCIIFYKISYEYLLCKIWALEYTQNNVRFFFFFE